MAQADNKGVHIKDGETKLWILQVRTRHAKLLAGTCGRYWRLALPRSVRRECSIPSAMLGRMAWAALGPPCEHMTYDPYDLLISFDLSNRKN